MKKLIEFSGRWLMAFLLIAPVIISCDDDDDDNMTTPPTLVEAASEAELNLLLDAVTAANLTTTLSEAENITVFAPTDAAFQAALNAYGVTTLEDLTTEIGGAANLESVLKFHVVGSTVFSADLADGDQQVTTLAGETLSVNKSSSGVTVSDGSMTYSVVTADVAIDNGVVHVIDGVLLPDLDLPNVVDAATAAGLTTLLDAVTAADLGGALTSASAITVFAPTNDSFADLLEEYGASDLTALADKLGGIDVVAEVLQFHVVPAVAFSHDLTATQEFETLNGTMLTVEKSSDGSVTIMDADGMTYSVTAADVAIENGVVHVIDGVLLPIDRPTVVEAATSAGLTTLLDAVTAANLGGALLGAEAITVFAPTNAAFADILAAQNVSTLDELITKLGADAVTKVLQFHVVPAVAYATDLAEGAQTVTTLAGEDLTITRTGSAVTLTDAAGNIYNVTTADVTIENGVVHVIDGVLLPTL